MTRTKTQLLAEADSILRQPNLSREDTARVTSLLELADAVTDKTELRKAVMRDREHELGRTAETPETTAEDQEFRHYLFATEQSTARQLAQLRALSVGTDSGGGFLVPQAFAQRFEVALRKGDGILDACTTFEMARGNAFNYPALEDTSVNNIGTVVAENAISISGPDLVFAAIAFSKASQWRSGLILASTELVQDSAFDFGSLLAAAGGVRLAKGIGAAMITTLLAGSTSALTAAGPTAVTPDELLSLVDSVDPAYGDNGAFAMRPATYRTILKLKGTSGGSFLFESERDAAGRPLLLGFPVYFCPSLPAMATTQKAIVFGDLSRLVRRVVANSLTLVILVERFAEYSEIGYEVRIRNDFQLLKTASSQPTKFITMG